ncbi:MAG: DNA alkylation repair protein [Pseudomonadota bacterium]
MSLKPTPERIALLSQGSIETQHLMDGLAVDFNVLLQAVFPKHVLKIDNTLGITRRMLHSAMAINDHVGFSCFEALCAHPSDTVRGIAGYLLALQSLPLADQLARVKPLADDPHFGVREWAWIAIRPALAASLDEGFSLLQPWVHESSVYVQRFAVEITRPRGVWCGHIARLKAEPHLGLALLDPLKSVQAKYVQDSVANWLNDASKSKPVWVQSVCARWLQASNTAETARICRRALRTLTKKNNDALT